MAEPMVKVLVDHTMCSSTTLRADALKNGRILELLLNRWALEGSEANSNQLVVPVSLSFGPLSWPGVANKAWFEDSSVCARVHVFALYTVPNAEKLVLG